MPTRMRPKRADELVGGSIHWIVKHRLVGRQEILRFEDRKDGRIDIVCSGELELVRPCPKRAHQGWRYLEDAMRPPRRRAAASPSCRRCFTAGSPHWLFYSRPADASYPAPQPSGRPTMTTASPRIDSKVAERAMLKHPFYQAWTEGRLPLDTLRAYARQYFHHVEAFPRAVSAVHSACPDRDGRRMLAENLAEEEGIEAGKQDHASLWLMFACGLGENEQAVRAQQLNAETLA